MVKKEHYGKEILGFSNLAHFYTNLDTFMWFPYTFIWSWTLPYNLKLNTCIFFLTHSNNKQFLHTKVSINMPISIKTYPLNVFKLIIRSQISAKKKKKMNRKQCWNMLILEYLLNSLPQVIYQYILKRLNKAL